jgi:hypothetical protein
MDKKGVMQRLIFEISYIVFSSAIGLAVLYFVLTSLNDSSLQTKIYAEDMEQTLNTMQLSDADVLKINYALPENIKFIQKDNRIFLSDGEVELEVKYNEKENVALKFNRETEILLMEKYEKIS